jgi:alpha-L-fucosidase
MRPCRRLAALALAAAAIAQQPVLLPAAADDDALGEAAASVRPSARQLAWQQLGFTAFVHFGMNTFTDREWGDGSEDPATFAPTDLDADQWAATFADAGMRGVILTCKHHDGFCLWPTQSTEHCVRHSPWRDGKGDVVRELADACRKHRLAFGVYLSPWDRNCKAFGTAAYQDVFLQQLRELCSNYGPLFEVWFDGAHCPADDPALFDWQRAFRLGRELQPGAVIAITGPDVRWVGNEGGRARAAEWSVLPLDDADPGAFEESRGAWRALWRLRERNQQDDLGSRQVLRGARRLCWWPAETDVSIRPGWFWHPREDAQVKPWPQIRDLWYAAVGGNSQLLLNVPPDRRGRIAEPDAAALRALGAVLRATFARDLGADALAKNYAFARELYFQKPQKVSVFDLREDLAGGGQRVEAFRIDVWDGQQWKPLANGGTIGARRLVRVSPTETQGCRCWIEQSRGAPALAHFSVHREPEPPRAPSIARARDGKVTIRGDGELRYTTDGSEPGRASARYEQPFALPRGGTVRALALPPPDDADGADSWPAAVARARFGIATAKWTVLEVSSEQAPREAAAKAFDGDPKTHWHSRYGADTPSPPHHLAIDLGETVDVTGFVYQPRQDGDNGTIADYEFAVRGEQGEWRTVAKGSFARGDAAPAEVRLATPATGVRAVRLVARREVAGRPWASCAELQVLVD